MSSDLKTSANAYRTALLWALEWIDAVPADVAAALPAMPGFDRDYVNDLLAAPTPAVIARPAETLLDSHINHTANFLHGKTPPVAAPVSQRDAYPAVLFDGNAVLDEITAKLGRSHCIHHNAVSETLDAVVRLIKKEQAVEQTSSGAVSAGCSPNTSDLASLPVAAEMRPDLASEQQQKNDLYNAVTKAGNSNWYFRALGECIEHLSAIGELKFDDEDTACWFWSTTGEMLGRRPVADVERLLAPTALSVEQEPKYGGSLFNRASGETIPADEPVFIFRARDCHAQHVLEEYASVLIPGHHRDAVVSRLCDFAAFERAHPDRMKEPDTAVLAPTPAPTPTGEMK